MPSPNPASAATIINQVATQLARALGQTPPNIKLFGEANVAIPIYTKG